MKKILLSIGVSSLLASGLFASDQDDVKIAQLQKDVAELMDMRADFEGNAKSGFQLAGYASFDWVAESKSENDFTGVKFAPIFHYQYGDIFQFEGELEITINSSGETDIELEYAAGILFLNDYMGLQVGKFMSPVGQFVQNGHPSWINKLPSAPIGFGHDGAAPTSNVGIALRGGLPKVATLRNNYVVFVANAPRFGLAPDGDVIIDATGKTSSGDAVALFGGRYALNPIGGMEIGISGAVGEAFEEVTGSNNLLRDYSSFGTDFVYNSDGLDLKAEYIEQTVGDNALSVLEGGTWKAYYAQIAYQVSSLNLEPVVRYGDYENTESRKKQIAVGLNYLFANNLIAKLAYENDDYDSGITDSRVRAQLAFGF